MKQEAKTSKIFELNIRPTGRCFSCHAPLRRTFGRGTFPNDAYKVTLDGKNLFIYFTCSNRQCGYQTSLVKLGFDETVEDIKNRYQFSKKIQAIEDWVNTTSIDVRGIAHEGRSNARNIVKGNLRKRVLSVRRRIIREELFPEDIVKKLEDMNVRSMGTKEIWNEVSYIINWFYTRIEVELNGTYGSLSDRLLVIISYIKSYFYYMEIDAQINTEN